MCCEASVCPSLSPHPPINLVLLLLQWVFYLFGASAVAWLPFWLPLPTARPSGSSGEGVLSGLELPEVRSGGRQLSPSGLETIEENQVAWRPHH
jgi:hypothetical protein